MKPTMNNPALATSQAPMTETETPHDRDVFVLPASFAQQRLFFLDQIEPGSSLYNVPAALRIDGVLDTDVLEKSLAEIVRRHEILCTTFRLVDGDVAQVISPEACVRLPVIDLRALPVEQRGDELDRLIKTEARRAFDLTEGPLLRTAL